APGQTPTPTPTAGGTATPTPTPGAAASPTPTTAPSPGGSAAIMGAGIYIFDDGAGVTSPQIIEYSTDPSTGATSQAGTVATGSGAVFVSFTQDGKHAYAMGGGNIWGYSVQSGTGLLTSLGKLAANSTANGVQAYRNSVLWAFESQNNTTGHI